MIDTLYQDFTTKLLPKIQDGLVITKDYFTDLFGRYIKYLIVTDIIGIVVSLIILVTATIVLIKYTKKATNALSDDYSWPIPFFIFTFGGTIVGFVIFFISLSNLVKDIYIPEIRVVEEIQSYINQ